MLLGMLGHHGPSFLKSHRLQQKLPATADTRPPMHRSSPSHKSWISNLLTTSLKRVVLMKIYLNCRYLVMYFWKKIKSHNKMQQRCSQPLQASFQAPLKGLRSAASISNALKITHGGTGIALDVARNSRSFMEEVVCPVGQTSRRQILTFCVHT